MSLTRKAFLKRLARDRAGFVRDRDPFTVARILEEMDAYSLGFWERIRKSK
ncbi:MAG: hypothetical protein MUP52_14695 [Candidatus Aminicenantes bacterium]|nr:hypothetical protein [Candidatus Aminicenantes bacterium]